MKKNVLIYLIFFICFFIFISNTYADSNIAGWWKATITIQQGDFVTGVWDTIYSQGKNVLIFTLTYLVLYLVRLTSPYGMTWKKIIF